MAKTALKLLEPLLKQLIEDNIQVIIAVCNKLIKQAYGISKSGLPYDKNYVSKLA